MQTLLNSVTSYEKVFIHINTWIAGNDIIKHRFLQNANPIAT